MTKPETYVKVAERYMQKFNEIKRNEGSCARDVLANMLSGLMGYAHLIKPCKEVDSSDRSKFLNILRSVRGYCNCLDKYPEFLAGELTNPGAFPDLKRFVESEEGVRQGHEIGIHGFQRHYAYLATQRLRATS